MQCANMVYKPDRAQVLQRYLDLWVGVSDHPEFLVCLQSAWNAGEAFREAVVLLRMVPKIHVWSRTFEY